MIHLNEFLSFAPDLALNRPIDFRTCDSSVLLEAEEISGFPLFLCLRSSPFPFLWFWRTSGGLTRLEGLKPCTSSKKSRSNLNRKWENISICLAVASWPAARWEGLRKGAALPALDCMGFVNGEALSAPMYIPLLLFAAHLGGQLGDCYSRGIICLLPKGWNLTESICFVHWQ